jgi:hypothetical protein
MITGSLPAKTIRDQTWIDISRHAVWTGSASRDRVEGN